jgi:replication factor A1
MVDNSDCSIDVTLWQDSANKLEDSMLSSKPIIAIKGLSVKEYNGSRTCGTLQQSMIEVVSGSTDSGISATEAARELVSWWSSNPSVADVFNLSSNSATPAVPGSEPRRQQTQITSIADMREECKRGYFGDKGIYFDVLGKLSFISTKSKDGDIPIHYSACSTCNRKLSDDGTNRCFACDKLISNPKLKYLLRAQFVDHSDQCYLSVFDAQALTLLRKSVEDVLDASKNGSSSIADELKKSYFDKTYHLRVRATAQEFKGEMRPRITVVAADPLEPVSMGNKLLKKIMDKIGQEVRSEPLESIKENVKMAEENEEMQDDEQVSKKMRMTESMDTEPAPVESKE